MAVYALAVVRKSQVIMPSRSNPDCPQMRQDVLVDHRRQQTIDMANHFGNITVYNRGTMLEHDRVVWEKAANCLLHPTAISSHQKKKIFATPCQYYPVFLRLAAVAWTRDGWPGRGGPMHASGRRPISNPHTPISIFRSRSSAQVNQTFRPITMEYGLHVWAVGHWRWGTTWGSQPL